MFLDTLVVLNSAHKQCKSWPLASTLCSSVINQNYSAKATHFTGSCCYSMDVILIVRNRWSFFLFGLDEHLENLLECAERHNLHFKCRVCPQSNLWMLPWDSWISALVNCVFNCCMAQSFKGLSAKLSLGIYSIKNTYALMTYLKKKKFSTLLIPT